MNVLDGDSEEGVGNPRVERPIRECRVNQAVFAKRSENQFELGGKKKGRRTRQRGYTKSKSNRVGGNR